MKFRKKPVVIEALQWNGKNYDEIAVWSKGKIGWAYTKPYVDTLEGRMLCSENDWAIKGVNGEFYFCKPDIFEKTYENVEKEKN